MQKLRLSHKIIAIRRCLINLVKRSIHFKKIVCTKLFLKITYMTENGHEGNFRGRELFYMLTEAVVTQLYTIAKHPQTIMP